MGRRVYTTDPQVIALIDEHNRTGQEYMARRMERAMQLGLDVRAAAFITVEGPERDAHLAAVEAYNAWAHAENARIEARNAVIRTERQARRNAAEVTATRAAACTRCYATHAGEC